MGIHDYHTEMKKVIIFGSGLIAELAHYYFTSDSNIEVAGFTVDEDYVNEDSFLGLPLISFNRITNHFPPDKYDFFIALSYSNYNILREEKFKAAKRMGYSLVSYVSSKATILNNDAIGDNCFILENNVIQPFVTICDNVTLWSGNHIGHHSTIKENVFIASHVVVSGGVEIGKNTFIGVNSTVRDHITIGQNNIIGAGSLIMKSTKDNEIYVPERTKIRNE